MVYSVLNLDICGGNRYILQLLKTVQSVHCKPELGKEVGPVGMKSWKQFSMKNHPHSISTTSFLRLMSNCFLLICLLIIAYTLLSFNFLLQFSFPLFSPYFSIFVLHPPPPTITLTQRLSRCLLSSFEELKLIC